MLLLGIIRTLVMNYTRCNQLHRASKEITAERKHFRPAFHMDITHKHGSLTQSGVNKSSMTNRAKRIPVTLSKVGL